jgi:hypothetical protein
MRWKVDGPGAHSRAPDEPAGRFSVGGYGHFEAVQSSEGEQLMAINPTKAPPYTESVHDEKTAAKRGKR